ncbi:MAG: uroporphyrinogen decarboxylase family protein [Clostridia bacterium]|nr:uroporphyrinogen decarboxylase family protein [Clostridia bacterium]
MIKRNMKAWLESMHGEPCKKAFPILSFPCIQLLDIPVCELISNADTQAKGMQLIAQKVPSAASVSLMDLSVEAECFGANVRFSENEVPTISGRMICDEDEAQALKIPEIGSARSGIYIDAIRKASEAITDRPIFAGTIGPFSLAARLLDISEIMMDCYDDPDMVHTVLEKATAFLIEYGKAYKEAGAHGIMMAEPVAGLLSPSLEAEFSAPYVKKIVDALQDDSFVIVYHNCGDNVLSMIDSLMTIGAGAYHFGNAVDMQTILEKVPSDVIVMGNVDPAGVLCCGTPETVRSATTELLEKCAKYPNFIVSSGCDIPPHTPWENIETFFEAVDEFYKR